MKQPLAKTPITRIPIPLWERIPSRLLPSPLEGKGGARSAPGEGPIESQRSKSPLTRRARKLARAPSPRKR
jgi:hypothetical protein